MRYGYWIDALLGVILIVSPYVGRFMQDHTAAYTNVIVGIFLLIWAIASYLNHEHVTPAGERHSYA